MKPTDILFSSIYGGGSGGSGLPAVTTDDNGKTLTVEDGEWVPDNNLFVVTATILAGQSTIIPNFDKTIAEIRDAYNAGKRVVCRFAGGLISQNAAIKNATLEAPLSGVATSYVTFSGMFKSSSQYLVAFTLVCTPYAVQNQRHIWEVPTTGIPASLLASSVQNALIPSGGTAGQVLTSDGNGGVYWA